MSCTSTSSKDHRLLFRGEAIAAFPERFGRPLAAERSRRREAAACGALHYRRATGGGDGGARAPRCAGERHRRQSSLRRRPPQEETPRGRACTAMEGASEHVRTRRRARPDRRGRRRRVAAVFHRPARGPRRREGGRGAPTPAASTDSREVVGSAGDRRARARGSCRRLREVGSGRRARSVHGQVLARRARGRRSSCAEPTPVHQRASHAPMLAPIVADAGARGASVAHRPLDAHSPKARTQDAYFLTSRRDDTHKHKRARVQTGPRPISRR